MQLKIKVTISIALILVVSLIEPYAGLASAQSAEQVIVPLRYNTQRGGTGGQPVSALAVMDQSGTDDNPDAYVSFTTPSSIYIGQQTFHLPAGVSRTSIGTMSLVVNFSGPLSTTQKWSWSLYNYRTKTWVEIGSNEQVSTPGTWTLLGFPATNPTRFISTTGNIRVMLRSSNNIDDARVDFEAIRLIASGSATPTVVPPTSTPLPTSTPVPTVTPTLTPTQQIGTEYYVSLLGNDSNPGTQTSPWKTIQKAVNSVNPGDTILVRGGTYSESVKITRSGSAGLPITLTRYNNEIVTINGGGNRALYPFGSTSQYWIIDGLRLVSTNTFTVTFDSWGCNGTCSGIDHWIFRNNYISGAIQIYGAYNLFESNEVDGTTNNGNGGNGIQELYDVSHHNIFRNNHVHHFSIRGIWSMHRTHDSVFEGNTIHDIPGQYCIDLDGFSTVEWRHTIRGNHLYNCKIGIALENTYASVVENNRIHNVTDHGIDIMNYGPHITGGSHPKKCEVGGENNQYGDTNGDNNCEGDITNNIVRQNLIYSHGSYGGFVCYHAGGIKLLGNTIIGNSGSKWGVRLDSEYCPKIEMQSNIIAGHSESEIILPTYALLTVDNNNLFQNSNPQNIYKRKNGTTWQLQSLSQYKTTSGKGGGSLFGDPQFMNSTAGDFHLRSTSPAIDHGVSTSIATDLDGITRPQGVGFDIGVYEAIPQ